MTAIGYEHLRTVMGLSAFPIRQPALIKPVTRVERTPTFLGIPGHVAPQSDRHLDHVLFALKHEPAWVTPDLIRGHPGHFTGTLRFLANP
jgi:hypothetical protein